MKNVLNLEGHKNCISGSKVTKGVNLPIGWVASGRVCACSLCSRLVLFIDIFFLSCTFGIGATIRTRRDNLRCPVFRIIIKKKKIKKMYCPSALCCISLFISFEFQHVSWCDTCSEVWPSQLCLQTASLCGCSQQGTFWNIGLGVCKRYWLIGKHKRILKTLNFLIKKRQKIPLVTNILPLKRELKVIPISGFQNVLQRIWRNVDWSKTLTHRI